MINITIIEDDFIVRQGLVHVIEWEKNGFKICGEAANGRDGFLKVEEVVPDIVITDIEMPIEDGIALCKKIRSKYPDIKIVILSGHAEFNYAHSALRLGVNDYLLKPINEEELLGILLKLKEQIVGGKESEDITEKIPCLDKELYETYDPIIKKAMHYVENNYWREIKIEDVVQEVFVSPNYFSQLFKTQTGTAFCEYLNQYRLEKAKILLDEMDLKVYQVAEQVGYQSYKHFSLVFKKYNGCTPKEYRRKLL